MAGAIFQLLAACRLLVSTFIPTGTGSVIGTMTVNGGLNAAFDGNTAKADAAACRGSGATSCYVGKTLGSSKIASKVIIYPTTDNGYNGGVGLGSSIGDLVFRGKQGSAPASSTDGTILGTASAVINATSGSITITSTDLATRWDHLFVQWNGSSTTCECSQIQLFEMA